MATGVNDGGRGKYGGVSVEKGDWGKDENNDDDNNASAPMAGRRGQQQIINDTIKIKIIN